jgi:hypothetical protein
LFIGLIGILVTGAVIRTIDKTERVAEAYGYPRGQGQAINRAQGRLGQGQRRDNGQAQVEEWLTIQSTVVSVDADTLVVQTLSGQQVAVENRAWWFAQEQSFSAQVGDQVTLVGFYQGDDFEVGRIENATNGQTVLVRDENGRPRWAGRGRLG